MDNLDLRASAVIKINENYSIHYKVDELEVNVSIPKCQHHDIDFSLSTKCHRRIINTNIDDV